ncbi:probable transcription factor At1g61730 [Triticum dicoccoides]|uniref:probable transcription factor At1g61730 n=1 Tax=Triticum dicoccoides TaxID=85692 RepID=UPI000E7BA219|nr:probable transcription factor At1g61730 [Triticum dicoccoides]
MAPKRATPRKRSATADPATSSEEDSSGSSTSHNQEVADEETGESESEDAAAAEESAEDGGEGEGESTEDEDEWEAEPDPQPAAKNPPQSSKLPARKRGKTPAPAPVHQNGEKKKLQHSESAEPKPKKSRRMWSPDDEVLILEELAEHRRQHGKVPAWGDYAFFESVAKRLEDSSCHYFVVKEKVRTLLRRYKSHILSVTDHDKRLDSLSEDVWGDLQVTDGAINGSKQAEGEGAMVRAENGSSGQTQARSFEEMCEVYPLLAQEVKMLAEVQPAVKSLFTRLDAKRALYMQKKLERIRSTEVKIQARMAAKVHAPQAKISEKLVRLLT